MLSLPDPLKRPQGGSCYNPTLPHPHSHVNKGGEPVPTDRMKNFFKSVATVMRFARTTSTEEFKLFLKLVTIGIAIVGGIGFLIKLIAFIIQFG
jgi:protein translocase SEC61 complex gamma subunit